MTSILDVRYWPPIASISVWAAVSVSALAPLGRTTYAGTTQLARHNEYGRGTPADDLPRNTAQHDALDASPQVTGNCDEAVGSPRRVDDGAHGVV